MPPEDWSPPLTVFHIAEGDEHAAAGTVYTPSAFAADGFVHCSEAHQVLSVAERIFRGRDDLLLLEIALDRLDSDDSSPTPVRWENLEGGNELYPHIYGPIPLDAIVGVEPFEKDSAGRLQPTPKLSTLLASRGEGLAHSASADDLEFVRAFEACEVAEPDFDHRAHVRLAYVYLCSRSAAEAKHRTRRALTNFLTHLGVDPARYHETLTRSWILAVRHFMLRESAACSSADEFLDRNPMLLDSRVMLEHYSAERLFSDGARGEFLEPDLDPIPRYGDD